jgi:hypothetical protein
MIVVNFCADNCEACQKGVKVTYCERMCHLCSQKFIAKSHYCHNFNQGDCLWTCNECNECSKEKINKIVEFAELDCKEIETKDTNDK